MYIVKIQSKPCWNVARVTSSGWQGSVFHAVADYRVVSNRTRQRLPPSTLAAEASDLLATGADALRQSTVDTTEHLFDGTTTTEQSRLRITSLAEEVADTAVQHRG